MAVYRMEFEAAEHEEFGSFGFRTKGRADFDPLMAVAHDVLEHFPDDDQTLGGECQALGASLWIRGLTGYYERNGNVNPPPRHVAADISRFTLHAPDALR